MARGPAPKPADRRARRNADPVPLKIIDLLGVEDIQPALPDFTVPVVCDDGVVHVPFEWPQRTRDWWDMWAESPLSDDFTAADWDYLLDTAVIHARFWQGETKLAAELRLRVAKFGQTPEDRLRLRMQFAESDEREKKAAPNVEPGSRSRARRAQIRAVGS